MNEPRQCRIIRDKPVQHDAAIPELFPELIK